MEKKFAETIGEWEPSGHQTADTLNDEFLQILNGVASLTIGKKKVQKGEKEEKKKKDSMGRGARRDHSRRKGGVL